MAPGNNEFKKKLISKRGQLKGKLSRLNTYFEAFSDQDDTEELQLRLTNTKQCLSDFETVQSELELVDEETDHSIEREEFENQYFKTISKVEKYIKQKNQNEVICNSNAPPPCTPCHGSGGQSIHVRLPTVNLPTFSGRYEDWVPFIDAFNSLIDHNDQLSDIQKLQYLKGSLKGQAAEVLQNLELAATNYGVALELLKKQFHNSRLIVQQHVKALFELPTAHRGDPAGLRQLVSTTLTHMRALSALKVNTDNWDPLIIHIITSKLDYTTHKEWELTTRTDQLPSLDELTDYLLKRSQTLETVAKNHSHNIISKNHKYEHNHTRNSSIQASKHFNLKTHMTMNQYKCSICGGKHQTFQCFDLQRGSYSDKVKLLNRANICINCLSHGHTVEKCKAGSCKKCPAKHNTLIHPVDPKQNETFTFTKESKSKQQSAGPATPAINSLLSSAPTVPSQVLLNTALVQVIGPTGRAVKCRALLDNGSESCFITENMVQLLGLHRKRNNIQVSGVNQTTQNIKFSTQATMKSYASNYQVDLPLLIIPKITGNVPSEPLNLSALKIPHHITLADPSFSSPGCIDLLIGQEVFWDLICIGQIKTPGLPTLQKTKLGWIAGGTVQNSHASNMKNATCHFTTLDQQLQRFWTLEETNHKKFFTDEEVSCEEHYQANTRREADGSYTVKMPFRANVTELGSSREMAVRRFLQVEKRLDRDPGIKQQYSDFMTEYIQLNHMELVEGSSKSTEYYLPHHPVFKTSSTTTKLRVVFDASAKTTTGKSLNDLQWVGPTVQPDLFSTITRFRMHKYVLTADLEKMYRQVSIDESQRDLLKIVWRANRNEPMQTYRLNTVTYGTASAPYLATRTLQQLAKDEQTNFPETAPVVFNDFYVDDLLTGTDSYEEAAKLQVDLVDLLAKGGFHLRKWNSNCSKLLSNLPQQMCERQPQQFPYEEDCTIKTLGLWWDAEEDTFQFRYSPVQRKHPGHLTKRIVLSDIARLFDPLGLVSPIIVRPKLLLQELWKNKLDWDESLPMHLHTQWTAIQRCLQDLDIIRIPRQVTHSNCYGKLQIHGFADASERAFGGAIYLRHTDTEGNIHVSLLCSKSRIAPLHSTSLPRLELCAALLLTEVLSQVQTALNISIDDTTCWTDSTVTLAWIRAEPARWNTFVANRVAKIQETSKISNWRHVSTHCNPADLVSRGETAINLSTSKLWWNGPSWLSEPDENWPNSISVEKSIPEERRHTTSCVSIEKKTGHTINELFQRKSSFEKITRILAYCHRFINNTSHSKYSKSGPLTVDEIQQSTRAVLRFVQESSFPSDIKQMSKRLPLPSGSKLQPLAPFIDNDGLIRVGGRLQESILSYELKHPILLPKNHRITELIARQEHLRNLHCGPQALLCAIREQYWPINGRDLVRKITHQCLKCFRARPKQLQQKMGNLPSSRVTPARPFLHTGVDYCGPFLLKQTKGRGTRTTKVYIAVFVCLATKAVHLELVSDLSTEAFLGSLKRFISRRGICSDIMSDNGKNFVGASKELKELYNFFRAEEPAIIAGATKEGIKWTFIPPYAPHMGGLWEAAVKSFKHNFRRIVGTTSLTFEEFTTVLTQIEAVLNSRPLTPLSNDPSDLSVLTPSHFLIGSSLKALPEPSLTHLPEQRLSRWQRVQRLVQHFWSRWSSEYLTTLQQRSKWRTASPSLQVGSIVLLKDDHLPPLSWPLGRVIDLHPGKDKLIRVVTVKTAQGIHKRNVNKLCLLPIEC